MVASTICQLEKKIRNLAILNGIRTAEFFFDFDKIRSGFITVSQFFRVLNVSFGLQFTCEEQQAFIDTYECGRPNMINYKLFCYSIDRPFDPKNFFVGPYCQARWKCYSKPDNFCWTDNLQPRLDYLLKKLHCFYELRGLSIKCLFSEFDHLREGRVSETRFYRGFAKPNDFDMEDIMLIVQKYQDPNHPGMVRYLELDADIKCYDKPPIGRSGELRNMTCCESEVPLCKDLQTILDEVSEVAHKYQVRCHEFFRDYDPLRNGSCSVTQFLSALDLCLGDLMELSEEEKSILWQGFMLADGRICYRAFCSIVDDAYLEPNLELKPTKDVEVLPPGSFGRRLNQLTNEEEECLQASLERIKKELDFSRPSLLYFFRNFDKHLNSGVVTRSQFARVLNNCNINIHPQDFSILCKKFFYKNDNFINYPSFIEAVDSLVQVEKSRSGMKLMAQECRSEVQKPCRANENDDLDVGNLMIRLRHHIIVNRIRPKDFFQDFDMLRSGRVTKCQFKRSLQAIGCGAINNGLNFSAVQLNVLADAYTHPCECFSSCWLAFVDDLESGYSDKNLEKKPCRKLKPMSEFVMAKPCTLRVDVSSDDHKVRFEEAMCKISAKVKQRNIDLLLIFKNFDKLRHGHVNRSKFRQALSIAGLEYGDELDMTAVEAAFYNVDGINYVAFLERIESSDRRKDVNETNKKAYLERIRDRQQNVDDLECCVKHPKEIEDLQELMLRFKSKLAKENFRVIDWFKDYDKLHTGYVSRSNFRRAFDQCRFDVYGYEICMLEDYLKCPLDPNMINYFKFSEELESIFMTPQLEKTPMKDVELFRLPHRFCTKCLSQEEEELFNRCMEKILARFKILRPYLFPFFRDFDKVNIGSVSKTQFRRALEELGLASEMSSEKAWNILFKKFAVQVGGREDVDYFSFDYWLETNSRISTDCYDDNDNNNNNNNYDNNNSNNSNNKNNNDNDNNIDNKIDNNIDNNDNNINNNNNNNNDDNINNNNINND